MIATKNVIDDNARHLFQCSLVPRIRKLRFFFLAIFASSYVILKTFNQYTRLFLRLYSLHQRWINRFSFKEYPLKNYCWKNRTEQRAIRQIFISTLQLFRYYRDFIIFRNIVSRTEYVQTVPSSGFYVYYVTIVVKHRTLHQRFDHVFLDSYFPLYFQSIQ